MMYYLNAITSSLPQPKCALKDNPTMHKTEAQIVSYSILYLNPSSHQCQPSYKKYIATKSIHNYKSLDNIDISIREL